jgi:glycosyltransferase involved in cell wall biosynthesis
VRVAFGVEQLLDPAPGGIGRYVAELARRLPERDDVDLIAFTARHARHVVDAGMREYDLKRVDPVILSLPRPVLYDTWHVLGAFGPLDRVGPVDLVHAPSLAVPPTRNVPLVVTAHDAAAVMVPETLTRRGRWFHRRGLAAAATRADLVITVSESAADEIAEHTLIARARIRVVPNGVELQPATAKEVARTLETLGLDDRPYVFWIGTSQPRKNVRVLVDAFTRALADYDLPHRLVLAGAEGWQHDDESAVRALGDRARVLGRVPDVHLPGLYGGADLFAFPSRHEGFGIPVLEAMTQETAVMCADIPVLHEVAGDAAEFVPPDDVDAWEKTMVELLRDDIRRAQLVARGRDHVTGYSWDRCADATLEVYREALEISAR